MPAWSPDAATVERAQITRFLRSTGYDSFEAMYRWSVTDVPRFTDAVLRFLDIPFWRPPSSVVDLSRGPEWPEWCIGGGLNVADCLGRAPADRDAVVWEGEDGSTRTVTYGELLHDVRLCAGGLRSLGVGKGDAVAIHLPMVPETVVALLACAHIGAIAVPLFSGYGPAAVDTRLEDSGARVLIGCDAFQRRGRRVEPARSALPEHTMRVSDLIARGVEADCDRTAAEDPLILIYTSGTTGRPKGIRHTHCGFPIKSAQDMCFGTDVGPGTRICWITDIGWMMGPWLIYGALFLGGTICLYDGAPDYPDAGRLWEFCARRRVEVLGISPTLVRALAVHGDEAARRHDLSSLRILASTGEPWNPDPWRWLFETVGQGRLPIINYSGGTEISGGILMGSPVLPVDPCAFAAPCPGIAADVVDDQCRSVSEQVGELVIRQPWIGMARGFHHDPQRYLATYWSRWPGVWAHGDWAMRNSDGNWYILGRSDDTLKVAGKRVGPAEVESILVSHPSVAEAAVIGVPHDVKGECMIAFCVLKPGQQADAGELLDLVAEELGKPLRPNAVHFVDAIPKTRNAKVMRRVIRAAYTGTDAGDVSALENPAAVEAIRRARETTA